MTLRLRPSAQRGHANHGWLDSRHTFSFADYFDPAQMGFRALRVINEDWVAPQTGFDTHPHRDMEILTYVIAGAVEHKDSTGAHGITRRGEIQAMTAGTGIRHSEMNPLADQILHLLQIWILPEAQRLTPGYSQTVFDDESKRDRLRLIASRDGRDGSLVLHQDVAIHASILSPGHTLSHQLVAGRGAWVQVVAGTLVLNGQVLAAGDGAAMEDEAMLTLTSESGAEFLLFDLA
ncbi:pirin family protein [Paramagnetospirillum magneticum]|uniref:Pirin-related protein n=1 Tax=Paramagnetospirillum magneticum (strain ATCC 700264 / AMB-1) TaxID=342108 RepID=Q2W024_PARM1|nr:pirin family protein [Paramagnetospirillum magneticum]BAE52801.1 Pirin-related protein [Paramagnetospirillum magneticum AMB-1]